MTALNGTCSQRPLIIVVPFVVLTFMAGIGLARKGCTVSIAAALEVITGRWDLRSKDRRQMQSRAVSGRIVWCSLLELDKETFGADEITTAAGGSTVAE